MCGGFKFVAGITGPIEKDLLNCERGKTVYVIVPFAVVGST